MKQYFITGQNADEKIVENFTQWFGEKNPLKLKKRRKKIRAFY
jgi:hypothetical protein